MQNTFDIVSYVGAKPLFFGMTENQVVELFGNPLNISVNILGEKNAQYKSFSVRYSPLDNTLVEAGFTDDATVMFGDLDVFKDPKSFKQLLSKDGCPYECYGLIVLLELGVALGGFHDDDKSQLGITVFARGKWDGLKEDFKKFWG